MSTPDTSDPDKSPSSALAAMVGSAVFWPLFALPVAAWLLTSFTQLHYEIDWHGADALWKPWYDNTHPAAQFVWGMCFIACLVVMLWWLHARDVRHEVVATGDRGSFMIVLALAGAAASWPISWGIEYVRQLVPGGTEIPNFREGYEYELSFANAPADLFSGVIGAPLFEETAFRGLMLGVLLARGWDTWLAVSITSLAFALTHQQYTLPGLVEIYCVGFIFGALRIVSGGLFAPILAHAAMNLGITLEQLHWLATQPAPA